MGKGNVLSERTDGRFGTAPKHPGVAGTCVNARMDSLAQHRGNHQVPTVGTRQGPAGQNRHDSENHLTCSRGIDYTVLLKCL